MAELCPTCHRNIGTDSTLDSGRVQGVEGVDTSGNPIPRWSGDPVFTPLGLSGSVYTKQRDRGRNKHIIELQESRTAQEIEAGIALTDFSVLDSDNHISRRHIIELRESTEKLLNASGTTLEDYFKFDDEGNEQPQSPGVERSGGTNPQIEWVDVERGAEYVSKDGSLKSEFELPDGSTKDSPTLSKRAHIRAIHIEDLRHPIIVKTAAMLIESRNGRLYKAELSGGATFTDAEEC